jgi:hypothetical protein
VMHIYHIGIICDDVFRTKIVVHSAYIFAKVLFTAVILPNIFHDLTRLSFWIFAANLVVFLCRIMSAGSPPPRVRQGTVEDRAAIQAKTMDRTVIAERNVIRSDIMVPPLDNIHAIIQTYNWGYLHSCACVVYTRLVKLFYANLEVVQNDDCGLVLQSTVAGHIITIDPQVISHIIRVPVLKISASPYKARSALPPSRLVPCPPPTAYWLRSFSRTSGLLLDAVI